MANLNYNQWHTHKKDMHTLRVYMYGAEAAQCSDPHAQLGMPNTRVSELKFLFLERQW